MPNYYKRRQRVEAIRYIGHANLVAIGTLLAGTSYRIDDTWVEGDLEVVSITFGSIEIDCIVLYPGSWLVKLGSRIMWYTNDVFEAQYESE